MAWYTDAMEIIDGAMNKAEKEMLKRKSEKHG
jgi:hypothetical protein